MLSTPGTGGGKGGTPGKAPGVGGRLEAHPEESQVQEELEREGLGAGSYMAWFVSAGAKGIISQPLAPSSFPFLCSQLTKRPVTRTVPYDMALDYIYEAYVRAFGAPLPMALGSSS